MSFKGNIFGAGTNPPTPGSTDLYDLSKIGKTPITNSITAGQTFDLKQLLAVNTLDFDGTALPAPKAGAGNIAAYSKTFFTLVAAQVNSSGEIVFTFKAGTTKTTSTTQLPGITLNYSIGTGEVTAGGGSQSNIYLFQIK